MARRFDEVMDVEELEGKQEILGAGWQATYMGNMETDRWILEAYLSFDNINS